MSEHDAFSARRGALPRALDVAVLAALLLLSLLGLQAAYGGIQFLVTGATGLLVGTLIALAGARWRWGILPITGASIGAHLLLGSAFAAPDAALWHVVPSLGSLRELLVMPVTAWKSMLTVAAPVGAADGVLGVAWMSMLLLGVLGMSLVLRTAHYVAAWTVPFVMLLVSIVFGTAEPVWPMTRGILFAVLSLAWLTWRFESARIASARSTIISDSARPGSWSNPVLRRRVLGGALILALACGGTLGAQVLLDPPAGSARTALRDSMVPPFDPSREVSPLNEFRGYLKDQRETTLFTVTGAEGGDWMRLATLDSYDLQSFSVAGGEDASSPSGAFLRTATGVDLHKASPQARTATITVGAYEGVWLPTFGARTNRVDELAPTDGTLRSSLYLNGASQTAVDAAGLRDGDSYVLSYEPDPVHDPEDQRSWRFSDEALPPVEGLPAEVEQVAKDAIGDAPDDYAKMENLTSTIRSTGSFSHGIDEDEALSRSGHGIARLSAMLTTTNSFDRERVDEIPQGRIGDQEQYAALTALLARSVGIPARVVVGFRVPEGTQDAATVTGNDVTAWVEVHFEGIGWVRFDPTPEDDQTPTQPEKKKVEKPQPQVAQPPPPPAEPPSLPPGATSEDNPDPPEEDPGASVWVVYAAAGASPLLLLALALGAIALAKSRRRTHRRLRGGPAQRIDGAWQELLDLRTDLGRVPDARATRRELAAAVDAELPEAGFTALAERADRGVFGPEDLSDDAVQEYWDQTAQSRRALLLAVPWHRRLRARFSLRSFRRRRALARETRDPARARSARRHRSEEDR
ncbi:transglutaminase family protein [Brachybacterium hainanense]|uniref:Transglutaminase domain-containing protein n=1 Tax=Brachybacterium hainanense TaxID=1541174 RepID=A0ABV6RH98_9MICO